MVYSMLLKEKARIVGDLIRLVGDLYKPRIMTQEEIAECLLGSASRIDIIRNITSKEYGMYYGIQRGRTWAVLTEEYIKREYIEELDRINVDYELLEKKIRQFKDGSVGVRG